MSILARLFGSKPAPAPVTIPLPTMDLRRFSLAELEVAVHIASQNVDLSQDEIRGRALVAIEQYRRLSRRESVIEARRKKAANV